MTSWPVSELLPHAAPMILIDRVLSFDGESALVEVTVRLDHPFATAEGAPVHLAIEFMAQACGALTGCWAKRSGAPVRAGFLLGTRHFHADEPLLPIGKRLTVAVTMLVRDGPMGVFECRLLDGEKAVAEAQLNVYQPDNDAAARAILTGEA